MNGTLVRLIYSMTRKLGRVPNQEVVMKVLAESGLQGVLICTHWEEAVVDVLRGCQATYKPPRRAFPIGLYLDALKALLPPERLTVPVAGKDRKTMRLTYEDVDNAAICYTIKISGKERNRRVGQCKRSDLIKWFQKTKEFTRRGCNKQKANALHDLLMEINWVDIHKKTFRFNNFGSHKPISIRYKLGAAHPEYKGEPEGWDVVD